MHILRCVGSKFCVKFQRAPLKFHTKFWTHTPQNMHLTVFCFCMWFTTSLNCDVISLSETGPRTITGHKVSTWSRWIGQSWFIVTKDRMIKQCILTISQCPFHWHGLTSIPTRISKYIHCKVWDDNPLSFPKLNICTVEIREWISNFISHFTVDVITYPCWD